MNVMNVFRNKYIMATAFLSVLFAGILFLDLYRERHFVHAALLLEGRSENEIYKRFPRNASRKGKVVMIGRKRIVSPILSLCGYDSSVVVYLTLHEGRIAKGAFSVWFPSMRTREYK